MTNIPETFLIHASEIIANTHDGLTWSMIVKFFRNKSIETGIEIPFSKETFPTDKLPNKRTGLLENLKAFPPDFQYKLISELCDDPRLRNGDEAKKVKQILIDRYSTQTLNVNLINETKSLLHEYPDSNRVYLSALEKYEKKIYQRNLIDDLRLSLELLLKSILNNKKSLENQIADLGSFQKTKGATSELSNMFGKLIDYYSKYQNNLIKHNDAVNLEEIDFITELTTSFIKYLLNLNKKK